MSSYLTFNVCIKDIRVITVSVRISDSQIALTIISQNLHVCSFQGTITGLSLNLTAEMLSQWA